MKRAIAVAIVILLPLLSFSPASAGSKGQGNNGVRQADRDEPDVEYVVDESTLPFDALPGFEDADRQWGVLDNAGYQIEIPADWNGELVMWAHGFRGEGTVLFFEGVGGGYADVVAVSRIGGSGPSVAIL